MLAGINAEMAGTKKKKKNRAGQGKLAGGDTVAHMETHSIKKGSAINV